MFWEYPLKIPAYDSGTNAWYDKEFENKTSFVNYVESQFKESPDQYKLRNTKKWKETGQAYADTVTRPNFEGGRYHNFTANSAREKAWREIEKKRVLCGVIYDGVYVPPFYYWYLNYCPIYDDLLKKKRFADVWDGDLWYMHYCMLAILKGKHIGGVKGRQKGYSYKHMAILYWSYCWFESSVNTVGGYQEDLVKKSWRYLEGYRAHINANTRWKRGPKQAKSLEWIETQFDENDIPRGKQSKLGGVTFKQRPDNDVGGAQTFFNYEEPGVSPTILETLEFMRPAVEKGSVTTGIIIACGSVGELEDAEGIKTIFYNPDDYKFLAVKNIWDENPESEKSCIFISEAYNMIGSDEDGLVEKGRPFMDADGNSDVEFAMKWIEAKNEAIKNSSKKAELKQLALSQKCTSPAQAFAQRKTAEFPVELLKKQQERIRVKQEKNLWEHKPFKCLLDERDGKTVFITSNLPPEHGYPIKPEWPDKRGVWTFYGPVPETTPENYTFFASVDAIEVDVTETSESIASVDIFQTAIYVEYRDVDGKIKTRVEGDKLFATYRGRFDTPDKTNEQIWYGIRLLNAFVYPERNKPNFINYMKRHGRGHYLATEGDVPLFKDLNIKNGNALNNSKVGFHKGDNTETWKHFKATVKEYFFTEYGRNTFTNKAGEEETVKIFTGIDRIDDYWLLEEFIKYRETNGKVKGNYDRLVSFMAALFICKIYQQNRFTKKRSELEQEKPREQAQVRRSVNMLGSEGLGSVNRNVQRPGKRISLL